MYICVCNAVNERQVKKALREGKQTIRELHKAFGFESCCGKCTSSLQEMLKEHRQDIKQ